jgi:hypothetical protein
MKTRAEIEATLERSLRAQVAVPLLNHRFDAAVWARIEAQESRSPARLERAPATAPRLARWLAALNVIGLAGVAIFLMIYGAQILAGMEVDVPKVSSSLNDQMLSTTSGIVALASLLLGFAFTPWGRRLRDEFS